MIEKKVPKEIAILILAAGSSSRMGQPKQLLPWQGKTLLEYNIDKALQVSQNVAVVLGAHLNEIYPLVEHSGAAIVENTNWEQGMGTSIARGIGHLEKNKTVGAVLIMLVDQPFLDKDHLDQLIMVFSQKKEPIVCTQYEKKFGVPAVFDKTLFPKLKALKDDFGARHLINEHKDLAVALTPKSQVVDIDTMEKYHQLLKTFNT